MTRPEFWVCQFGLYQFRVCRSGAKSDRILVEIWLDFVRCNKIWLIFSYNYKYRVEILMDLAEICLYCGLKSLESVDLPVFGWNSWFPIREEQLIERVGFIGFSNNQPATRTDALGSMRRRLASDRNQALIGRFWVKMIGFPAGHGQPYPKWRFNLMLSSFSTLGYKALLKN